MPIHGYPGNVITANPTAPTSSVASGVWTTEQQLLAVSQGNWPGYEYPISRSLRFNSADSAYLNRTFGSPTNAKKWTYSLWVKGSPWTNAKLLAVCTSGSSDAQIYLTGGQLQISSYNGAGTDYTVRTDAVYRDPSSWYHFVFVYDTDNGTSANRAIIYVNGVRQSVTTPNNGMFPSGYSHLFNTNGAVTFIGARPTFFDGYFGGYLTEINFVDGQALDPSSFGLNDPETGVWSPKRYTGTYGTNGFYLNFSDNSGTTSTTLGKDSSGNGNNWTPNNFSVTAGAGNDSLVDSPTAYGTDTGVGGTVRGNYCTLNPLQNNGTLSNGNLDFADAGSDGWNNSKGTIGVSSGKFYWEMTANNVVSSVLCASVGGAKEALSQLPGQNDSFGVTYYADGRLYYNGTSTSGWGSSYTNGDVIGIALDMDNGKVWFSKNGTWQASGDPATGANAARSDLKTNDDTWFPMSGTFYAATTCTFNFGQRAFAYTAPSGFKALCTQNLPTPTIGATSTTQANDYFNVLLYNGSATSQNITGVGFSPDLVWIKTRSNAESHQLVDQVRGATKALMSNETSAETTWTNGLSAFLSDGFTLPGGNNRYSDTGYTYVAWNWNAGGSTVTNTSGTISAQVRANTTSGFSIVTYTGTGSSPQSIGHGLGATPAMIILKSRSATSDWYVNHVSIGTNDLRLNLTNASAANNFFSAKSSTTFTINFNQTGDWVAYCFAPVAGYSAFGSYTGNGSTDGPFVYLGFRPEFIMTKSTSNLREWYMYDAARDTYNVSANYLRANTSSAEGSFTSYDMVSNGFKLRSSDTAFNGSGETYIYMAFAESPFKYSLAR